MRRYLDRLVIALACALGAGGWVCRGSDANPCPGALTCEVDVATVCCPFGSSEWCNGCASSCLNNGVYCNDESGGGYVGCPFSATIGSAACGDPVSTPQGVEYTLTANGTVSGCEQDTVLFKSATGILQTVDCGSWKNGVYGGCVAPSAETSFTSWTFIEKVPGGTGSGIVPTPLQLVLAHGPAGALATTTVVCGPAS